MNMCLISANLNIWTVGIQKKIAQDIFLLAVFCGEAGFAMIHFQRFLLESQDQGPVQHGDRRPLAARGLQHMHSEHQISGNRWAVEIAPKQIFESVNGRIIPGSVHFMKEIQAKERGQMAHFIITQPELSFYLPVPLLFTRTCRTASASSSLCPLPSKQPEGPANPKESWKSRSCVERLTDGEVTAFVPSLV